VAGNGGSGSFLVSFPGTPASGRKKKKNLSKKLRDGSQRRISTASGENTNASVPHSGSPKDRTSGEMVVSPYCQMLNHSYRWKNVLPISCKRLDLIVCYPALE
jgi:hypothetical protein